MASVLAGVALITFAFPGEWQLCLWIALMLGILGGQVYIGLSVWPRTLHWLALLYVMEPPEAFEALMIKAIEIAFPRDMETAMMLIGAIPVLRAEALHENDALPPNDRLRLDPWS